MDSSGLVQRPRAGSYEHGNGSSDPPNSDNLTTWLHLVRFHGMLKIPTGMKEIPHRQNSATSRQVSNDSLLVSLLVTAWWMN